MSIGKMLKGAAKVVGTVCAGAFVSTVAVNTYYEVKEKVLAWKGRRYYKGYEDGMKAAKEASSGEIEWLRKENSRLYADALKRSEAAE